MPKYWIAKATAHHKGVFSARYCGSKGATAACISRGLHSRNPTIRKRANLARTLEHLHHV